MNEDSPHSSSPVSTPISPTKGPLGPALRVAGVVSLLVALWLFGVVATVLPARDPARIPLWAAVAVGLVLYAALSLAGLGAVRARPLLRTVLFTMSVVAAVFGGLVLAQSLKAVSSGGHFEGYLLLLGAIVLGHGLLGVIASGTPPAERARLIDHAARWKSPAYHRIKGSPHR